MILYERREMTLDDYDFDVKIINHTTKKVIGSILYTKTKDNGIEINSIYNHPLYKGTIMKIYFDYFLKKYNYIMSGGSHSRRGERFWDNVLIKAKRLGYKTTVINKIKKEEEYIIDDVVDVKKYYDNENYQIKVAKNNG